MDADDMFQSALEFIGQLSPIIFGMAVIAFADLLIDFLVTLFRKAPTYTNFGRRTRR